MSKNTDEPTLLRTNDALYDASYYDNYNGEAYGRTEHWLTFFDNIADNIVRSLQPRSVLDVGCAFGLLVERLRDRGVDAFGMDVSQYAVSQGRPDILKYLSEASILKPLDRHYDLIVTIEVVEHIQEDDCDLAIKNICDAADSVLLATTPDGFDDPTHFNVNAPFYWIRKFSKFGFEPDVRHDADYITPYAMLFRRKDSIPREDVHALFGEKKLLDLSFSRVTHEKNLMSRDLINTSNEAESLKEELLRKAAKVEEYSKTISDKNNHIKNLEATMDDLRREAINLDHAYRSSTSWRMTAPIRYGSRLLQAFFPLFPKTIAEAKGDATIVLDSGKFTKWARIELGSAKNSDCHLALTADTRAGNQRVSLLRLSPHESNMWLARAQSGAKGHSLRVLRGAPSSISVSQISALSAWRAIFLDRWRRGRGLTAALRFARNSLGSLVRRGLGPTLNDFWPNASEPHQDYDDWLLGHDTPEQHKSIESWIADLDYQPLISIILPTYNANPGVLSQAVASVTSQSYGKWELCIADDASTESAIREWLKSLEKDERIKTTFRSENGHISAASNSALALATGEFVTFLDHDDQLHPHALAAVAAQLNKGPDLDLVYSDEDKIDENGNRFSPNFKSGWNPDLLLSQNYICRLAVYRRALVEKVGGLREGYEGAQDYDLALRVSEHTTRIAHIPHILYHWRAIRGSTALAAGEKDYAHERSVQVVAEALERRRIEADVLETGIGAYHRVRYALPVQPPRVTVIIPTRDQVRLMETCIGGLLDNTDYPDLEILIIDNDSQLPETRAFFDRVRGDTVRILDYPGAFNYSAINNFAAKQANGEVLVLLNNDIEVIHPDWLRELVSHALRPGIGAVGARLYYPDDHVQHDGIIIGMGGVAGYAHPRIERSNIGVFGGSRTIRNYSAVTAAALAIRKEIFDEVGGLDEINLAVAFNDVDFCLRVQEAGYRNLYTPFAELYHHESVSRGHETTPEKAARFEREALYMKDRWATLIKDDPCYSPNLSLMRGFTLDPGRGAAWPWQEDKKG